MNHGPANSWSLVDWSNPFSKEEEEKFSCEMMSFVAAKSGQEAQICVHTFNEVITDAIKKEQRWRDCNILPDLWTANGMVDNDSLYIDIGANIGSCVMEMLLSTKANIVAFEPHPMNVYNIKKTVSKLGKEYQDRILLFPVGLGSTQSSSTIFSGHDNMGNSQLGAAIQDWGSQEFREHLQFTAYIERLDSLLDASKIDSIRFVKMDCQGFECNAVDGMGAVAEKINYLKFEYAKKFLTAQGCTDIVSRLKKLGFDVFHMGDGTSTKLGREVFDNPPVTHIYDTPELMAKRPGI
ncbi:hypothetical protein HJC23_005842 [Cyclotella cryptica]|uniref:Methyltransferase FkbM domain-containing protein n=1 Tax=Cyclotella cryptica TaxID=29204 RepID=A0ABD3QZC2_9STRA